MRKENKILPKIVVECLQVYTHEKVFLLFFLEKHAHECCI